MVSRGAKSETTVPIQPRVGRNAVDPSRVALLDSEQVLPLNVAGVREAVRCLCLLQSRKP